MMLEWWMYFIFFLGGLLILMSIGMPIAIAFLGINILFMALSFGFDSGMAQLTVSIYDSLIKFALTPIPLFILMGETLFRSGLIGHIIDTLSKLIGRVPGRLSLLTLGSGALFSNLSGSAMANTALLGSTMIPEMQKRGYKKSMIFGPIMGAAGLAIIIPPSTIAVLLGSIANIPVGPLLIAGIIPGLMMAVLYLIYILLRCTINKDLAPFYETETYPWSNRIFSVIKYILPLGFIIFSVLGSIILGIATPTEAASFGALTSVFLVACYGNLKIKVIRQILISTAKTTGLVMFIIAGAAAFSQLLSLTGSTRVLVNTVTSLDYAPIIILLAMLALVFVLGTFLEQIAIMLITMPLFMPVVIVLGFDPIWFGILMLIAMEIGTFSPPFGMILFVMKGVAPADTSMLDIYKSAIPFIMLDGLALFIVLLFPWIATWLPSVVYG